MTKEEAAENVTSKEETAKAANTEQESPAKIFVKGLPHECTKAQIKNWFSEYGNVEEVIFRYGGDSATRVKGIAFVRFESSESSDKLIEKKFITVDDDYKLEIRKYRGLRVDSNDQSMATIPKEALKCYVCKRNRFATLEAFLNHKQGKQHQVLLRFYRAKSASVLQLLKAESKLAADRLYDVKWLKENVDKEKPYCKICQVHFNYSPSKHEKSTEHKMVVSYVNKRCCDIEFTDRNRYDSHLLSIRHLKTTYEKEQENPSKPEQDRLTMKKAIDIYKQCDQDLKELKEKYPDLDLNEEIPPFDNQPIGLNHIVKKINYYCVCCDQKFFANINFVKPHCRSYNHYLNVVDYMTELEKERQFEITEKRVTKKKDIDIEDIEIKKRERDEDKDESEETSAKKAKTEIKNDEKKKVKVDKEDEEDPKDHDDVDFEMPDEDVEDEEEGFEDEQEEEHEEDDEEDNEEREQDNEEPEQMEEDEAEDAGIQEEAEEEVDNQAEEEEEEEEEEEAVADNDDDNDDIQVIEGDAEPQEPQEEEIVEDSPVEEVKDEEEEEEEEVVEIPKPRATRGRRGRGRGRGVRR